MEYRTVMKTLMESNSPAGTLTTNTGILVRLLELPPLALLPRTGPPVIHVTASLAQARLPPPRSPTMVPVEHVQLAACMLGLLLQPLEEVEDLDLLVAAVQHVANLSEGNEGQCRKDDENMDAGPEVAGTRHLA